MTSATIGRKSATSCLNRLQRPFDAASTRYRQTEALLAGGGSRTTPRQHSTQRTRRLRSGRKRCSARSSCSASVGRQQLAEPAGPPSQPKAAPLRLRQPLLPQLRSEPSSGWPAAGKLPRSPTGSASTSNDPPQPWLPFRAWLEPSSLAEPTQAAARGSWPLAGQPGRVPVSTRSHAFSGRCATEHGRPGESPVSGERAVRRAVQAQRTRRTRRPRCRPDRHTRRLSQAQGQAFPLVKASVVGLAGLQPAASSISEIDGQAPCYPAFPQAV